jgi:antitoxin ParD1/3/4
MNINFAPIDESFIKNKIEEGYYSDATELVRDAVRKLREKRTKH